MKRSTPSSLRSIYPGQADKRRGFGSTIIERSIPYELKGEAKISFKLSGMEARFVIPQRYLSDAPRNADTRRLEEITQRTAARQTGQIPRHVLVVEDSMIIAMDTEDSLRALGVTIVTTAGNVATAIDSINADLRDDGIPFVLATGYGELADTVEEYGAQALLKKPYGKPEIEGLFV